MGVALTGSTPRFPLAPIPTLVPQAKSPVLGVEPSTTPLITSLQLPPTEGVEPDVHRQVGGGEINSPTFSRFPDRTPYPLYTASDATTDMVPRPITSVPLNSTISSLPAQDPLPIPPTESLDRDESTAMLEVGRFASIVYPQRRWKGFTNEVGTQQPPR